MNNQLTREEAPRYHEWHVLEERGAWEGSVPDWAKDHRGRMNDITALRAVNRELLSLAQHARIASFQTRAARWGTSCMGAELVLRKFVRLSRFFEEACELVQSLGMSARAAVQLVGYVWSRPRGEPLQEAGAGMLTLALLCNAHGIDMFAAAESELARVSEPALFERIRAKALAAPPESALPVAQASTGQPAPELAALEQALAERDALRAELDRRRMGDPANVPLWQGDREALAGLVGRVLIDVDELRALLDAKASSQPANAMSESAHGR